MRPAHRDYKRTEPYPEEWLLIEWPKKESEPTKYWFSTVPEKTSLKSLVKIAKHRWIIERDYEELKQELGLGHYEGRGLARFSPSRHVVHRRLWVPDQRAEPFFPLSARRQSWIISPGTAGELPPARVAASAPNGIIPTPLPRCGLPLRTNCSGNCLTVPSADPREPANLPHLRLLR